jgi:type IV conjugative transfer system protein TraL
MDPVRIPSKIDEPMRFLFFRMDAFILLVVIIAIGGMTGHPVKAMFGGLIAALFFEKLIKERQFGLVNNYIYHLGFGSTTRTMVDPYKKKYHH